MIDKEIFVLWDTEYTAWEGSAERNWNGENEDQEIVQISAIKVSREKLEEVENISLFIKPTIHTELSSYFTNLTGITQKDVEEGVSFEEGLESFKKFIKDLPCYSYGNDESVLRVNYNLHNRTWDLDDSFFDARDIFSKLGVDVDKYSSGTISEAFGEKNKGRNHNALDDSRSMLQALQIAKSRGLF